MAEKKICIAGSGGQGVLLLSKILATAGMFSEKNVTLISSYGAEMRGGVICVTLRRMPVRSRAASSLSQKRSIRVDPGRACTAACLQRRVSIISLALSVRNARGNANKKSL